MVHAKNKETASKFVKVMHRKLWLIFPDTVYIELSASIHILWIDPRPGRGIIFQTL